MGRRGWLREGGTLPATGFDRRSRSPSCTCRTRTARTKRTGLLVPLVIWKVCECSEPGSMSPSSNLAGAALTVPEGGGLTGAVVPGDDATGVIGSFGAGSVTLPRRRNRRGQEGGPTRARRAGSVQAWWDPSIRKPAGAVPRHAPRLERHPGWVRINRTEEALGRENDGPARAGPSGKSWSCPPCLIRRGCSSIRGRWRGPIRRPDRLR